MKKKLVLLLCAVCMAALVGGCGTGKNGTDDKKENTEQTEEESEKQAEAIEYNVDDYVELGEYKGLEISLGSYDVTDEDVKSRIDSILTSYPVYEDLDKDTVEDGDFVNIDYEGLKDGVAFDGGTAEGAVLEIGSDTFIDGFEDGLIGKKVGEKVALDLTFPEGYQNEELAGQAVVFNVTVNKIVSKSDMTYDKMDDAFIAENMSSQGYETVEAFEKGVREQMEEDNESQKKVETQAAILQKLREVCKVNGFPEGLLEQKIDEYMERFESNLETTYGMKLEDYLQTAGTTEEDFEAQINQLMTESLEGDLILEAIAKKENMEMDEEAFEAYKTSIVEEYGYASAEALVEQYGEEYIRNVYRNEQILEMVGEQAQITYSEEAQDDETAGDDQEGDAAAAEEDQEGDTPASGEEEEQKEDSSEE